jgi:hypothetical protein
LFVVPRASILPFLPAPGKGDYWGLEEGLSGVYTDDEKDFKKIPGLQAQKP